MAHISRIVLCTTLLFSFAGCATLDNTVTGAKPSIFPIDETSFRVRFLVKDPATTNERINEIASQQCDGKDHKASELTSEDVPFFYHRVTVTVTCG